MDDITIFQKITAIVALFGAGLSLYNLYRQKKDKEPSIKITTSYSFIRTPGIGITSPYLFTMTAMNTGHVSVHLSACGLKLPDNKKISYSLDLTNTQGNNYRLHYSPEKVSAYQEH